VRNLGLIVSLWLASIILPTNSLALGLGEIEVNSFLNQPLHAEIEVISARAGEIDDLLVSLASREAFTRAGLSRPRNLTDLRFLVKKSEDGDEAVIVVTTKTAIKEPFLNFLIEADWSKGRVLREFTIFLDPPFYAETAAAAESASEEIESDVSQDSTESEIVEQFADDDPAQGSEEIIEPIALLEDDVTEEETAEEIADEYVAEDSEPIIEGDVLVVKGDTLWSIASRYQDAEHSMSQVMLAFLRTNPDAFNDGNINNLKLGAVLRAPDADELDALDKQDAYAQTLVQNGLWDDYVARVTGTSPSMAAETDATGSGVLAEGDNAELSLLVPGDGDSDSTGTGDGAEVSELRTRLAMAEEELDASRIENADLESRIAELQARLSKVEELQKMVEIEDDSLAQLQAEQAQSEIEEADTTEAVSEKMEADEEALLEELLAEEAAAQLEEESAVAEAGDTTLEDETDIMVEDETDTMVEESSDTLVEDSATEDMVVEDTTSAGQPPPAPVIVTAPVSRSASMFDGILPPDIIDLIPSLDSIIGDPIILGAVGGLIVLLLILVILKRRRGSSDEDSSITASDSDDMFAGDDEEELTPIHLAEGTDIGDTDTDLGDSDEDAVVVEEPAGEAAEDDFLSTSIIAAVDMPEAEASAPAAETETETAEQDDVLNEIDVYLAYGLYDNAEELLKSNLAETPDRADYRSKLLDTHFATKNIDSFVAEAQILKGMGESAAQFWDRIQVMGYELAPDNALFSDAKDSGLSAADIEISRPQEADFDLGASEDDTNFSTTDFNLGDDDGGGDYNETLAFGETQTTEVAATQVMSGLDELPDLEDKDDTDLDELSALDDEDETNIRDEAQDEEEVDLQLPDDIGGELEFSLDDDAASDDGAGDEEPVADTSSADIDVGDMPIDLDIEDDLKLDVEAELEVSGEDISDIDLGADFETALDDLDAAVFDETDIVDVAAVFDETEIVDVAAVFDGTDSVEVAEVFEETLVVGTAGAPGSKTASNSSEKTALDLGMDDTAIADSSDSLALDDVELEFGDDDADDSDDDISVINFGGDDFDIDDDETGLEDSIVMDVAIDSDKAETRTGTFAPGDFEEPTATVASLGDMDDIGDLMLPDDVDEVATKLDLARAFIDMGDTEGARGSLKEVMSEGNDEQKAEAQSLLEQI